MEHIMHHTATGIDAILSATAKARCRYLVMTQEYMAALPFPALCHDNRGNPLLIGDAYMVITCENGHKYYVNVTADSPLTACAETFAFVQYKL